MRFHRPSISLVMEVSRDLKRKLLRGKIPVFMEGRKTMVFFYPIYLQTNPLLLTSTHHINIYTNIYTSSSQSSLWPTFTLHARTIGKASTSACLVYLRLFNYDQVTFLPTVTLIFLSPRILDFPKCKHRK